VFATIQLTQVKSTVFVIGSELPWHYCTIIRCVMHICAPLTLAIVMATCSYIIYFWRMGSNRL